MMRSKETVLFSLLLLVGSITSTAKGSKAGTIKQAHQMGCSFSLIRDRYLSNLSPKKWSVNLKIVAVGLTTIPIGRDPAYGQNSSALNLDYENKNSFMKPLFI